MAGAAAGAGSAVLTYGVDTAGAVGDGPVELVAGDRGAYADVHESPSICLGEPNLIAAQDGAPHPT